MANKPIEMSTLRQIAQLKHQGKGIREISRNLGLSRNTVRKYLRHLSEEGFSLEGVLAMEDGPLSEIVTLHDCGDADRYERLLKLLPAYSQELQKVGVSRQVLWGEYRMADPEGYSYSQFCYHFQQWLAHKSVTMHFDHKAGDKVFVDFTGKRLTVVDSESGEERKVEVFVAILGASQLTYVEALESQQKGDFLRAMRNCLSFFGGVPLAIVPDNLKSAVTKSSRYEPLINEQFEDFGRHYGTTILPTRSGKPRDKALVENAVRLVYSRIFAPLRDQTFFSLSTLNQAIRDRLTAHNELPFQGEKESRRDRFEQIEKEALKPLPTEPYVLKHYAKAKVQKNSHVLLSADKHYYSVPFRYSGKQVKIVYTAQTVEIYSQHQRIASHPRDRRRNKYTTVKDHMPSTHQFMAEWNPEKFLRWAGNIGPDTQTYIAQILEIKPYPEQAYRTCLGILNLATKTSVGKERLNKACQRAHHFQSYGYHVIKRILDQRLDQIELEPSSQGKLPLHPNIRGKDYYQ